MSDKVKKIVGVGLIIGASFFGGAPGAALAMKLVGAGLLAGGKKKSQAPTTTNGAELQLSGDPIDVRSVCYGEAWTAGTLRYRNTANTDNKDLYMVIVLAGHEIDSVQAVEADRQALTLDGSGNVTSPAKWVGLMNVRFYTGADSQTADSTLDTTFANWTTDHRLRGLAYAIVKLSFNEENLNTVPAFRFKVRGRKVYDPRLDSTNGGTGSHRLATPSTWAWSRNPVLCANDFLRGVKVNAINVAGLGLADTRFDWSNVIAEANVCDENVSLAAGGTEDRYTADGFIDPRQTLGDCLRHFETAIAGEIIPADGKWRFFCGAYRTPTLALTDQHFIGPISYNVHKGELDRYDTAEGKYAALAESGTVVNYSPVRLSTATSGSERLLSLDFQLIADTTDSAGVYDGGARAQRVAKLLLEKEAAGKRIQCRTNLYGLRCVPGETVQITHSAFGLSAQTMRVVEVQLVTVESDGAVGLAVDLTLEAGPSSLYSWSASEVALSAAPALPQQEVPPVAALWTPVLSAGMTRSGKSFYRSSGGGAWDAGFYSVEKYGACSVSFQPGQTNLNLMVGLNSDPSTDNGYASIDYALNAYSSGELFIYQSGTNTPAGAIATYAAGDALEVNYDGNHVRFVQNGTVLHTIAAAGLKLGADSSFYDTNAQVNNVSFIAAPAGKIDVTTQITGTVPLSNENIAARGWTNTTAFSVGSASQVNWSSGTFTSADGTSYSISSGNTGTMSARTYIYLDTAVSTTTLQKTTTATNAVGAGKVLIASAINGTDEARFQVFGGLGGQNIDAADIVAGTVTANELASTITWTKDLTISSGGKIKQGKTSASSTTAGFWLGDDGGSSYDFHIGNSTAYLWWDGSAGSLTVKGSIDLQQSETSVTPTWTSGWSVNPTGNMYFRKSGNIVFVRCDGACYGTASGGNFSFSLGNSTFYPSAQRQMVVSVYNAGTLQPATLTINTDGTCGVVPYTGTAGGFSGSGNKGFTPGSVFVYSLD